MQQQNKKRYIVFDPDDSPEEMVLRINNEIEATIDCYLQNNPKVKRQAFTDTLHGFLKQADRFATTPADKKNAIMQVLISFI